MYTSAETPVRMVERINLKDQGLKSRHLAGLIGKIAHFQIGLEFVPSFEKISFLDGHEL
jgi:hypothetical protein